MDKKEIQSFIARRVAELQDGDVVNLGIRLPTLVANYVPEGERASCSSLKTDLSDSTNTTATHRSLYHQCRGAPCTILPGGAFFNSATSFGIMQVNM